MRPRQYLRSMEGIVRGTTGSVGMSGEANCGDCVVSPLSWQHQDKADHFLP